MDHDRRDAERSAAAIEAAVEIDGSLHPCKLKNISATGAQIALEVAIVEGAALALVITPYAPINGTVIWRKTQATGIKFNDSGPAIEEVLLGLSALPSAY